jgi:hypothetical protein
MSIALCASEHCAITETSCGTCSAGLVRHQSGQPITTVLGESEPRPAIWIA